MPAPSAARIGVIGGSGLYDMPGLTDVTRHRTTTPYGDPSDEIVVGQLEGTPVAFLPRQGRGHRLNPAEVPSRANIYALKALGAERVIAVSAVGSLQEGIAPMDMVAPSQLIDRTRRRPSTYYEEGIVAHVSFAEPFCPTVRGALVDACRDAGATVHDGGDYVVIEGPAFSTVAESRLYRSWGASVIGMTALPEAKLAREAELCYAILACVTDYDVWHPDHDSVTVQMVVENLERNVATAQEALRRAVPRLLGARRCACASALDDAVITAPEARTPAARQRLRLFLGDRA